MTARKPSHPPSKPPRCIYISRNGRQCRYVVHSLGTEYCWVHGNHPDLHALHKLIEKSADNFRTPEDITNVLYTLFFATLHGTISERRAGVLAYLAQTILNTQRASIEYEKVKTQKALEESGNVLYRPPEPPEPPIEEVEEVKELSVQKESEPEKTEPEKPEIDAQTTTPAADCASTNEPAKSAAPPKAAEKKIAPQPKPDLNHFYPRDPTLPASVQNPDTHGLPPPTTEELARRHATFNRAHGLRPHTKKLAYPRDHDPDWKIINGH
jgi:outer membrane biosynthesis protein TonB